MEFDILDKVQLIEREDYDVVLLGNEKGGIPVVPREEQLELFSCAINNTYHPLVSEFRNLLDFCGIDNILIDINSKKKNGYISNVFVKNKNIGKYSLEELVYLISASVPEIRVKENLLETDEYDSVAQSNIPIKYIKKSVNGPKIDFPDVNFIELKLDEIKKEPDEKYTYHVSFSKDSLKTCFHMPKQFLPFNLLEDVRKTNGLLMADFKNRDSSCFDSLTGLLNYSKTKVTNAYVYDRQFVNKNQIYPENCTDLTCAIELKRKGKTEKFILPNILGVLYGMELGKICLREPIPTSENLNEPVYFG